jgi:hypothetical protein
MTENRLLPRVVAALFAGATGVLLWFSLAELGLLSGIGLAMLGGAGLALVAFVVLARHREIPVEWRRVLTAVVLAGLVTVVGMLINLLFGPNTPGAHAWVKVPALLAMPGLLVAGLLAGHKIEPISFFGGFALNMVLWTFLGYLLVGRLNRERA